MTWFDDFAEQLGVASSVLAVCLADLDGA